MEMTLGAGIVLAKRLKAKIIDPRPFAVGSLKKIYENFPLTNVLPAMGYGKKQINELQKMINSVPCDCVIDGSPFDLSRLLDVKKDVVNVHYDLKERGKVTLRSVLRKEGIL